MRVARYEVPGNFHHRCAVPSGRLIAALVPRIFCMEFYVLRSDNFRVFEERRLAKTIQTIIAAVGTRNRRSPKYSALVQPN
jgi:hypothetical protein